MKVRWGARSEVGLVRKRNEDSFLASDALFAVADGMGGHRGGDVASSLALEVIERAGPTESNLRDAVLEANREVFRRGESDSALQGMGTTVTIVVAGGHAMRLAHVGDSRAYLFRDGELRRLTEDHTLVQRWVNEGRLTAEDAERHPQRSIVTRSLGVDSEISIDEMSVDVRPGDRLLLCTDGLTGRVDEGRIRDVLEQERDTQGACDQLVEMAIESGGDDNVTVIALDVEDNGEEVAAVPGTAATTAEAPAPRKAAARKSGRRPSRKALIGAGALLIVLVAAFAGFRIYLNHQWYVGDDNGMVAVYQGIPAQPLGVSLSHVSMRTDIPAAQAESLQPWQDLSSGITVDSQPQASALVGQIRSDVGLAPTAAGSTVTPTPGPSPSPSGSG